MTDPKRPSFPWYPGDHRRDANVQACSYAARGLWLEMMNLMHDGEPYGHLTAGGKGLSVAQIAQMTGGPIAVAKKLLKELEDNNVFARTPKGIIYSRRMVKDEATRRAKKAAGKLGGNPVLLGRQRDNLLDIPTLNPSVNGDVKPVVNQPHNHPPATAVTVAVASPSAHPSAVDRFLAQLPDDQKASHWAAIIDGWRQGMGFEGGKAASADDIDTGLTEYLAGANRDFAVIHVRSFVERARRNRIKAATRTNGHATDDAALIWELIKSRGIHHRTTEREINLEVQALVGEGHVKDAKAFKTILDKLDFDTLRKAQTPSFAVKHIADRLNGSTLRVA